MSVTTITAGRHHLPALALTLAVLATIAVAVLAIANPARTGTGATTQASAPAGETVPTPYWLQRYLDLDAPAANHQAKPESVQRYLEFGEPGH